MEIKLEVDNIGCSSCAKAIETGLRHTPGVGTISVDVAHGIVSIQVDTEAVGPAVRQRLAELGFPEKAG
ncbi:copper chaperone CopZ [Plasticicumulans lactativorans]|uniref:Copper chaperone CopZ n=1 Tax=Plasticicumulans lactativorans TaxID=1133106 RepID=A0A4R2LSL0_9GAMM|nr:heavy metal-associated domain-containing protein [Plasticicumulans lactativorans]TCO82748.1 copper chaperone CopZ [Plasticicumulans lactativorans]